VELPEFTGRKIIIIKKKAYKKAHIHSVHETIINYHQYRALFKKHAIIYGSTAQ